MVDFWFGIPREEIKWFPTIDYNKCEGCMLCVKKCCKGVYEEKEGKPIVAHPNNCVVGCAGCDKFCPQRAVEHPPREYLEQLKKREDFKAVAENGDSKNEGCSCADDFGCGTNCECGGK
jgi:NAD-dependent dihydropyrimidine dehydrogenase PreA subunit